VVTGYLPPKRVHQPLTYKKVAHCTTPETASPTPLTPHHYRKDMASRNIFTASPTPTKRKQEEVVLGEKLGECVNPDCNNAPVERCCPTFGGCVNFLKTGCRYKISKLGVAAPCSTCLADINAGVPCLGLPNPKGEKTKYGKIGVSLCVFTFLCSYHACLPAF